MLDAHVCTTNEEPTPAPVEFRLIAIVLGYILAVWMCTGSTGLLASPTQRTLTLIYMAFGLLLYSPYVRSPRFYLALSLPTLLLATVLISSSISLVSLVGIVLVLGYQYFVGNQTVNRVMHCTLWAVVVFFLYRAAMQCVPSIWLLTDRVGGGLGHLAGWLTGKPLWIGATFAGLDFIVLTTAFACFWLSSSSKPRGRRVLLFFLALIGLHLCYLFLLSYATQLRDLLPNPATLHQHGHGQPAPSSFWPALMYKTIPWNLPLVGGLLHLLPIAGLLRWTTWDVTINDQKSNSMSIVSGFLLCIGAGSLILLTGGHKSDLSLQGKQIRFYDRTYVNWVKPAHGRYGNLSGGMCGILPTYLESMGAEVAVSSDVNDHDLEAIDLLIVYCPSQAWQQKQLQAIEAYVQQGGSLLLISEHTIRDHDQTNWSNDLLQGTSMEIPFDSAMFAVGGWAYGYDALLHPSTQQHTLNPNPYGVSIGASVHVGWPASPILAGRWGWADYGDEGNSGGKLGNWLYDSGEKLGDLVHLAEQRVGKGRIMAFGDTTPLMNTTVLQTHPFTMRVLADLCAGGSSNNAGWRQILAVLLIGALLALLYRSRESWVIGLVVLGVAGTLWGQTKFFRQQDALMPTGDLASDLPIAYIDTAHLPSFTEYLWRQDDLGAFVLTLMRNGCLPYELSTWSPERLAQAGLLISVAPARAYTAQEIDDIHAFVSSGGVLIVTVGYEEAGPSRTLLSSFGFSVGIDPSNPDRKPLPMGRFKAPYLKSGNNLAHVRFHAAWPVWATDPNAQVVANGRGNLPVIQQVPVGKGRVVVVGDTGFIMNKNLEREDGQPIEGHYENADFWRWYMTRLLDKPQWIPPVLTAPVPPVKKPTHTVIIDPGVKP
jgi:hypothetical protein